MARLYAPAGLRSLGIDEADYTVGEDGTVEVEAAHVATALAHGCRTEPHQAAEPAALDGGLGAIEERVAALEARLAQLEAGRRREPR